MRIVGNGFERNLLNYGTICDSRKTQLLYYITKPKSKQKIKQHNFIINKIIIFIAKIIK